MSKKIIFIILTVGLFTWSSCTQNIKSSKSKTPLAKEEKSLPQDQKESSVKNNDNKNSSSLEEKTQKNSYLEPQFLKKIAHTSLEDLDKETLKKYFLINASFLKKYSSCLNEENNFCHQEEVTSQEYFESTRTPLHYSLARSLLFAKSSYETDPSLLDSSQLEEFSHTLYNTLKIENQNIPVLSSDLLISLNNSFETKMKILESIENLQGEAQLLVLENVQSFESEDKDKVQEALTDSILKTFEKKNVTDSQVFVKNLSRFQFNSDQFDDIISSFCDHFKEKFLEDSERTGENLWSRHVNQIQSQILEIERTQKVNLKETDIGKSCFSK